MISDLWVISTFQVIKESKFQTKKVNVSEQKDTTFIFLVFIPTLTGRAETASYETVTPRSSYMWIFTQVQVWLLNKSASATIYKN